MNFAAVVRTMTTARSAEQRVSQYDWKALSQELSSYGCAVMKKLLSPEECRERSLGFTTTEVTFEATFTWRDMVLAKVNIVTSNIHCPIWFLVFALRFIHASLRSPMIGTSAWELMIVFLSATLIS